MSIKVNRHHIIMAFALLTGLYFLYQFVLSNEDFQKKEIDDRLQKTHSDAMIRAKAGIEVYAAFVASIKSFTKNAREFPTEKQLQNYLKDLLNEIKFKDSIVVSYLDKNHIFKYVISPNEIDPANLKGVSAKAFLNKRRIDELETLMNSEQIKLFTPVNLREGWVGFPFNFSVRNKDNVVLGYAAPVINAKYLLNYFYEGESNNEYLHKFIVKDSFDLTREAFYDRSQIFNDKRDLSYYKNFDVSEKNYVYSYINVFDLKLKIGSAYKVKPKVNKTIAYIAYLWYFLVSMFLIVIYSQFTKNKKLNKNLILASDEIVRKNSELEANISKIRTLIKEIHHRIKNNMQMISGVLSFQQDETDDENIKSALEQSKSRIHSMALVHEKLYDNTSLKHIRIKEYVEELLLFIENTIRSKELNLFKTISIDEDLIFDGDTTANLGLIINELITNSFKHAFNRKKTNTLEISIQKEDDHYLLTYSDNGEGLPDDYNFKESQSLGLQLVLILSEQLNGGMEYTNNGLSTFIIKFRAIEYNSKA